MTVQALWQAALAASQRPEAGRRRLLRATLAAGALGATATSPHAAQARQLSIWYDFNGLSGMRKVAQRFTQATGVPCHVEGPEDMATKFRRAATAGKGPDVFLYAHDQVGEWMGGGLLRPVTPSARVLADTNPLGLAAFTSAGRLWGYPFNIQAINLLYNKALVATPPSTWDEVFALDVQLQKQGRRAILWEYTNGYFTWPIMAALGGFTFARRADGSFDSGVTGIHHAGAEKGLALIQRLITQGLMPEGAGYPEMEAAMGQGRVAMAINGPWAWAKLRKAGIDFGVARLPTLEGRRAVPMVGVHGAMINRSSPHRELAVEFIENHLLQPEGLRHLNDDEPIGVPASKTFYAELAADPRLAAVLASAEDGQPMPNIPEMGRFFAALKTALSNVTQGRQTPRQALDAAAQRVLQR